MKVIFFHLLMLWGSCFLFAQNKEKQPLTLLPKMILAVSPVYQNQNVLYGAQISAELYVKPRWGIQVAYIYPIEQKMPSANFGTVSNYRLPLSLKQETRYIISQTKDYGRIYTALSLSYQYDKMDKTLGYMKDADGKLKEYNAAHVTRNSVGAVPKIGYQFFLLKNKMTLDIFGGLGIIYKRSHHITDESWYMQYMYGKPKGFSDRGTISPKATIGFQLGFVLF